MDRLRQYHNVGDMTALPVAKVAAMVCAHMRSVFMPEHRKAIKNDVELIVVALEIRWQRCRQCCVLGV